jgi:hypothetical protein
MVSYSCRSAILKLFENEVLREAMRIGENYAVRNFTLYNL